MITMERFKEQTRNFADSDFETLYRALYGNDVDAIDAIIHEIQMPAARKKSTYEKYNESGWQTLDAVELVVGNTYRVILSEQEVHTGIVVQEFPTYFLLEAENRGRKYRFTVDKYGYNDGFKFPIVQEATVIMSLAM